MVLERVISPLLNHFLGKYIENLDSNQLNVGIWGGDVKLENLILKQSALDDLGLPIQTVYGRIGKLVLKIPWKSPLTAAVFVNLEDIYLIAAPNQQVKYDHDKEIKKEFEAKQKKILKVELAKKPKEEPKASQNFFEKLATQFIKHVQINIKRVHIRYEDKVTCPNTFALGITLKELDVETTDENWMPCIVEGDPWISYKILNLEGLAVYWNSATFCYSNLVESNLLETMSKDIPSKTYIPVGYSYILGPVNASARLRINQRPELESPNNYNTPKIHLNLDMEKLFIGITKAQYRDLLAWSESMSLMSKGSIYRKYRPDVTSYKGHYKEWWHFAYTCILENEVRRKSRNWDWNHIYKHRQLCKEYFNLYQKQLQQEATWQELEKVKECERVIDVFNIIVIRQRAELETERKEKHTRKTDYLEWMWGWRTSSKSDHQLESSSGSELRKQFDEAMTPEEKERLYKAIDYHENEGPQEFPEQYVDNSCTFLLRTLEVELCDDDDSENVHRVLFTELKGVRLRVDTRSGASAIKVHVKIDEFTTFGLQQKDFLPKLIISETGGGDSGLLEVTFETNPLDKSCGQRLYLTSQPLRIVYDAKTINKVINIFTIPSSSHVKDQLSSVADNSLANIKEMSATGLQYAINRHTHLDLKIDLHAPYILIPYGGKYMESENVLVINLGNFRVHSKKSPDMKDIRKMHEEGLDEKEILKQMIIQSYDVFDLEIKSLQVLIAQSNEDWKSYIKESKTADMHLLNPVNLQVQISTCMITDDPRLPLTKISGKLPSLSFNISDARLLLLTALASSIPLPQSDIPEPQPLTRANKKESSSTLMLKYLEMQEKARKTKELLPKADVKKDHLLQFTTIEMQFVMSELSVNLKHQENLESELSNVASFNINSLEFDLIQQTYNTKLSLRLATIGLVHYHEQKEVNIISSCDPQKGEQYLFNIKLIQVNKNSPEFHSVYRSCETNLILEFAKLEIMLHKESLLSLIKYATDLQTDVNDIVGSSQMVLTPSTSNLKRQLSTISETLISQGETKPKKKKTPVVVETVKFKLSASVRELSTEFTCDSGPISSVTLKGINTDITIKTSYTQINANLNQIAIADLNPESYHKMIVSVIGNEALCLRVVLYELDKQVETEKPDMSIDLTMGGLRIVFLNWFVNRMLDFLSEFQAAQAAVLEASEAAAKTAKENVQNVYAKATKLSLSVDLKAPDIIVPSDSKSYDAVLLDLGHISVSNKFITLDIKNEKNFSAVIDELRVALTDFKLSRIKLNEKNETVKELTLLVPLTFKLIIRRNLTSSWYKAIPDVDIIGQIDGITLLMSQLDYKTIMSILNGNLAEGEKKKSTKKKPSEISRQRVEADISLAAASTVHVEPSTASVEGEIKADTVLRFTFAMDRLTVNLFTGGSEALTGNTPSHDDKNGLARFCVEGISVKGRILTDGTTMASFLLVNCLLDDMRKGREDKLNRLLQRTVDLTDSASDARSMIDVIIQMKDKHTFLDVRVFSFTLILSVDFLLKIADFFHVPKEESTHLDQKSVVGLPEPSKATLVMDVSSSETESQLTLNLKVEKPDIILVEHMDNIDTKALILNSEMLIKLRTAGTHQVINGSIKELQLYTCSYNPAKRADTKGYVLHPVTISLAGSTPQDKGLHLELVVTDIRISVSPGTTELLSRVIETATGSVDADDKKSEMMKDYSDLWNKKPCNDQEFWFLREADEAMEATENLSMSTVSTRQVFQELCLISVPSIVLTIEAGVGNKTLPMLVLQSSFKGNVCNWSSKLNVDSSLALQMSYYNSRLALWEPLIEPVEVMRNNKIVFVPWELRLKVSMNEQDEVLSPSPSEPENIEQPVPALMNIDITSEYSMELVITRTCLEVINNLSKAFATAMKPGEGKPVEVLAPYKVVNELGCAVTLNLEKGTFALFGNDKTLEVLLDSGAEVPLHNKLVSTFSMTDIQLEVQSGSLPVKDYKLYVNIKDKNCELELPVVRADKRYFPLNYRGESSNNWGVISDIKVDEGVTVITLRSILQVHNHFNIPIEVFYMTLSGNELSSIATVEPDSVVNIPLHAVYTPTNELFFSVAEYSVTNAPYTWKDLQTDLIVTKMLHCASKHRERAQEPFIIQAVGEMEQVYFEHTSRHTVSSTCYNIHLRPAVICKNCLPINIAFCIENTDVEITIEPGETLLLRNVEPGKTCVIVRIPEYLEKEWSTRQELTENPSEFSVWTFHSYDSAVKVSINLGMHVVNKSGSIVMALYCPFWMLNKTGLMLGYRSSEEAGNVLHHPPGFKGPILFSFNAKNFFGKKKAAIRVEHGDWSDKFSLDVAGSSGVVVCKYNDVVYQIGVHNQLTYNGLTKQVTFTPYYVIINNAPFAIECQENDRPADPWITVEPNSCSALWSRSELDDKLLKLRAVGSQEVSAPFLYTESHTSLLKLKNRLGGINVDIQISEGGIYISLAPYEVGTAPALIINHTGHTMNFWEKESVQIKKLPAKHYMLYTWDNPSGPRMLVWEGANKKEFCNDLRKDDMGDYAMSNEYEIYWVSFLDGMQRILIFTEDKSVAQCCQTASLFELFQQDITVSICGVGLSLVNNIDRQEIMYMAMASSGIIWEQAKANSDRFKHFSHKESAMLEDAYQKYLVGADVADAHGSTIIDAKTVVDFRSETMLKPHKRKVKRTFRTGLWLQMKSSPSQLQLHAKINRLQIDNQMYDCIFPVVLAPVAPPKSVAIDSGIKPFAELSVVQLLIKNSQVKQYKYFKLLIQEFHVKVDLGFINALGALFPSSKHSEHEEQQLFLKDKSLVDEPLYAHVSTQSLQEQKNFYDLLHFSPLKIHLSFSLAAGSSAGQSTSTPNFMNVLLQGIGVTLTDLQDVVFKLAYFERDYTFLTKKQLMDEVTKHYVGQSVKQLYVLVLGLDVIGNPYGLVIGITKGVEDLFYEPFQGAIQGPGEFAEGLVLGVRSLFGHTVGGAAGAVSRITGVMGKGIAALTFDQDYQRKRRDQINKRPATVQEGIARSGKGLVMGVVDGVTGVFTKPITGAKEEGVGGFFKGLGKGAVGLVARPTAGVVDFASGSLDAVKRCAEFGEEAHRLRAPRFLQGDCQVRPYNSYEAYGNKLLMDLEKGKYATTDIYDSHYPIIEKKEVLLLTDKRLAFITHNEIFGGWQIEWSYTWQELKQPASVVPKGVAITTSESKKKKLSLFGSGETGKIILIADPQKREEICNKIESLRGIA